MRTIILIISLFLALPSHAHIVKTPQQDETLDEAVNALILLLQDSG